jgi:hypothetical protein
MNPPAAVAPKSFKAVRLDVVVERAFESSSNLKSVIVTPRSWQ